MKSGLPLGDCLRIVSTEAEEPVTRRVHVIVESRPVGIPIGEAGSKLYRAHAGAGSELLRHRDAIQSRSGGNLSEALGNLSNVLRDRKKIKQKIPAMSMEAKASASSSRPCPSPS